MQPSVAQERTAAGRLIISALSAYRDSILSGFFEIHQHAQARMEQRKISRGDLLHAVGNGDICMARRHDGQVRGIFYSNGFCIVVGAETTPPTDFRTLKPVVITVYDCTEEYEPQDEVPIVPYKIEVDRPLEDYSEEQLVAALERKRVNARQKERARLESRQAELQAKVIDLDGKLKKLTAERDSHVAELERARTTLSTLQP